MTNSTLLSPGCDTCNECEDCCDQINTTTPNWEITASDDVAGGNCCSEFDAETGSFTIDSNCTITGGTRSMTFGSGCVINGTYYYPNQLVWEATLSGSTLTATFTFTYASYDAAFPGGTFLGNESVVYEFETTGCTTTGVMSFVSATADTGDTPLCSVSIELS